MKEDIKILECENVGDLASIGLIDLLNEENGYDLNRLKRQALENLIKGYRELEEENEHYKKYSVMMSTEGLLINGVKFSFNEFIPVSKVKGKIEELEKYIYKGKNAPQDFLQYRIKAKIQALQELMEDK